MSLFAFTEADVARLKEALARRAGPIVVVVANLKGGTAKSTSAAFLAHALAAMGLRVRMIDADPQGSTLRWQGLAEWSIPVLGLPTSTLHRQIWGVIDPASVDVVVVDTPPLEEQHGVVVSALRIATDVVIPMAPTMMELDRLGPVWRAIEDSQGHRDDDPRSMVLLNRTVANASSTEAIRGLLVEQGRPVLATHVPRREIYAQAFGAPIGVDAPYSSVATELAHAWIEAA